jgi:hypothetical protein
MADSSVLLFAGGGTLGTASDASIAYSYRIQDMIIRIKEDLGVDELLLAIDDSQRIASEKVSNYLQNYKNKVEKAVQDADKAAVAKFKEMKAQMGDFGANIKRKFKTLYKLSLIVNNFLTSHLSAKS